MMKNICAIFNASLATSKIPAEWKAARIPIPKKAGTTKNVDNFRPISILPVVAKVFESLVFSQVYRFLMQQNILNEIQSGFRVGYCTQDVLPKVVDDWRRSLDKGEIVGSIFVDLIARSLTQSVIHYYWRSYQDMVSGARFWNGFKII